MWAFKRVRSLVLDGEYAWSNGVDVVMFRCEHEEKAQPSTWNARFSVLLKRSDALSSSNKHVTSAIE